MSVRRAWILAACAVLCGCDGGGSGSAPPPSAPTPFPPAPAPITHTIEFSFANGMSGWEASYSDYSLGQEPTIAFAFGIERVPRFSETATGLFLTSHNRSDDVFMYATRQVTGLTPGARYRVETTISIATNAPAGCAGIGGAPGEAVALKAGAASSKPATVLQRGTYVALNIDKGDNVNGGPDARTIGNIAQELPGGQCSGDGPYQRKTLTSGTRSVTATAGADGQLWLIIGTESGFEGLTRIYLLEGVTKLVPL